jgi:predicted nucleic acid-binding protein
MKCVVDTSGWYAFIVEKDARHRRAADFLRSENHRLIFIEPVFIESTALIQSRQSKPLAVESGALIRDLGIRQLTSDQLADSWNLFVKTGAKVSYVDCCVSAAAKELDYSVFGFDRHFTRIFKVKQVP